MPINNGCYQYGFDRNLTFLQNEQFVNISSSLFHLFTKINTKSFEIIHQKSEGFRERIELQQMDIQSSEGTQSKNTKLIDGSFVVDFNNTLGGGSYSQVYVSWVKGKPEQKLACKVISKVELDKQIAAKKGDENSKLKLKYYIMKRIQSEVEIGRKIIHPNITRFIYFSQTPRNIYIFMEICECNLESYVKTKGPLPEKQAVSIFRDIVSAACILYDRNITHRDIKAQNILLKNGVAKLADFGFAKELRQKDTQEDGTGVGTMIYMAPQLIFQEKPQYSIRCDVWSIGVVMYYVLYGNVPWDTRQTIQAFRLSLKKPVDFPSNYQVSPKMKNLISKMLIFKDEERINIKQVKLVIDDMMP